MPQLEQTDLIESVVGELVAMDCDFTVKSSPELQGAVLERAQRFAATVRLKWA